MQSQWLDSPALEVGREDGLDILGFDAENFAASVEVGLESIAMFLVKFASGCISSVFLDVDELLVDEV